MRYPALLALLVLALGAGASANADPYATELDGLAAQSDWNELIMRVNQPRTAEEFRVGLDWLRDKSVSGIGGLRIHYSYALGLFRAGIKETSTFAYLLGLLQRMQLITLAINMETRFSSRPPDAWLCSGGLAYFNRFAEKHKNNPNPPAREIQDPTRPGRTILLEDPDLKPEFVTDEEWQARRKQIIARFVEQLPAAK